MMAGQEVETKTMIRNILIGLDGSRAATELAIKWAKRLGAALTGIAILDDVPDRRPGLYVSYTSYKVLAYLERLAHLKAETRRFVADFGARCAETGVRFTARVERGDPVDVILALHDDYDVTLLPREPHFRFQIDHDPANTLTAVLRQARRPIVAVPETISSGDEVLVAYDGSPAAVDALHAFAESGLGIDRPVTVVCADENKVEAVRLAEEAARYLGYHDVRATIRPLAADPSMDDADTLAAAAAFADAGMVVMGAFSHGRLREWFRPSVTTRMLARPGRLLYLHHHPN
jgi:nucleotide-binding universal stress UspA family protein